MGVHDDLGAVGAVGAPSPAWWCVVVAFDAVAVVDLGVMPFAEQAGVRQAGVAAVDQFDEVVDVAEPVRGVAAGEDAGPVALDYRFAQVRWGCALFEPPRLQWRLGSAVSRVSEAAI